MIELSIQVIDFVEKRSGQQLASFHFNLFSLNFAFLAPLGGLPDGVYGQLRLTGLLTDGSTVSVAKDFASQDQNGAFQFANWLLEPEFSKLNLSSVTIDACMFDGLGNCLNDANNPVGLAQFALALRFAMARGDGSARALFVGSITYLPLLWTVMILGKQ